MTVIAFPYSTEAERPLKVLRADLSARIAQINQVRRVIEAAGIAVESQDLLHGGKRPLLRLVKGDLRLRGIADSVRVTGDCITAVINGVDVQWPRTPVVLA